jgi:osmotically-inducible protein OsmY
MQLTDTPIQDDIVSELKWDPSLRDDDIAVAVRDGVVTLAGYVDSYTDKMTAERLASSVRGVRAVANDLTVKLPSGAERSDPDLARAALDALKWNVSVPSDRIKIKIANGWVTLDGEVDWYYQKEAAERSVLALRGVKGVSNLIALKDAPVPADIKQLISSALQRGAAFDAERITVTIDGHTAILRGTVRSYTEMKDAERAARNARGVTQVKDELRVNPNVYAPV